MFNENDIPVFRAIARAAGELLSDPAKRCTGVPARDKQGKAVWGPSEHACQWCVIGALEYIRRIQGHPVSRLDVTEYIQKEFGQSSLVRVWEGIDADQDAVVQKLLNL